MNSLIDVFPWNKNFETGIAEIDEQHKVLVGLINQLASHLGNESDLELLDETFVKLADYAVYHFQSEELIWEQYFPTDSCLKGHKETHKDFVSLVLALKAEEATKPINDVIEDVLSFLTHWLAHHILDSDMRMSKIVLSMKSGFSLESAQQQADKEMSGVMAVMLDTTLAMYDHLCTRTLDLKREINERKKTENKLLLALSVFDNTIDGVCITDRDNNIVNINAAFTKITGFNSEDVIGQNPSILGSGKQDSEFYKDMWKTLNANNHWQGELWNRRKNGELYPQMLTISPIVDQDNNITHYLGILRDITQSQKQQEKLEMMAHFDVLTQLPNRLLLADRFTQSTAHCKRSETQLAVCFLDLDDFKPVNDKHGHDVGDQLLIEVAERIKINLRDEDTVSRQGGDEFVLLLGNISSIDECEKMLERIIFSLAKPYNIGNETISIGASIGVSLYPGDEVNLDTLLRHADQAMYQAKIQGRNRYQLFNTEQDQRSIQKNIQLQEIQQALLNNELCLYYQPKVNMVTGKVFGAEALIRWIHPEKGLIPPLKFLPIIEGTELEIQIGNWVINNALKQMDQWRGQGIQLEVSVNISSFHLQAPYFVKGLEEMLAIYPEVNSQFLQLEILESSALGDLSAISNIINSCINDLGVNIALDDFGTGYSSLTHLRNLAAHTIKIDQTFVRDVLDDPNDYAIIDGVIGLANAFNRQIIAEGVETSDHGLMLLIMGCINAQGYGIARPMPANDISSWLSNHKPNDEWLAAGNKTRTPKETKMKLFRLALTQWLKHFENNINSAPGSIEYWPIMVRKECLCGYWIKRVRQEQLFEEQWLNKLDEAHELIHRCAEDLFKHYQKDDLVTAREGLEEIRVLFDKMNIVLAQCE